MRHRKRTAKLGRNTSHRRCLMANMLKSLITYERLETSVARAKELRRHADRVITLAKKGTLAAKRKAIAMMMVRFNTLTSKETRRVKQGDISPCNDDRLVMKRLAELARRFEERKGGYTRILRVRNRIGDNSPLCIIEYLGEDPASAEEPEEKVLAEKLPEEAVTVTPEEIQVTPSIQEEGEKLSEETESDKDPIGTPS